VTVAEVGENRGVSKCSGWNDSKNALALPLFEDLFSASSFLYKCEGGKKKRENSVSLRSHGRKGRREREREKESKSRFDATTRVFC